MRAVSVVGNGTLEFPVMKFFSIGIPKLPKVGMKFPSGDWNAGARGVISSKIKIKDESFEIIQIVLIIIADSVLKQSNHCNMILEGICEDDFHDLLP